MMSTNETANNPTGGHPFSKYRLPRRSALAAVALLSLGCTRRNALDEYVHRPDPAYNWDVVKQIPGDQVTVYLVHLISQNWRHASEVDRTLWEHWLVIARPNVTESDTALLFIGGGSNGGKPPEGPDRRVLAIAARVGVVAAELRMVPNQPLRFTGDGRARKEDDLIAYTWNQVMDTGDKTWAARMPMVKSAVRAMDAIQEISRSEESWGEAAEIDQFIVAGGSKRGWTTWLTGAVDQRVKAIVPIVIDVVNVIPSMEHHHAAYGFWAPAIGDYERNGIMKRKDTQEYRDLIRLVDPYYYRDRLRMPKYIINATGDQFFLPDSSQFYFSDLRGEKYLRYVPNADHSLSGTDAGESLAAYVAAVVNDTPRPRFSWTHEGESVIRVTAEDPPTEVRIWQATNPEARDFRVETLGRVWESRILEDQGDGTFRAAVDKPDAGWTAFFVELTYGMPGKQPLKFTTDVRVVPDVLPHAPEEVVGE